MSTPTDSKASRFAQARADLKQARLQAEEGRQALFLAREHTKKIIAEQARLERIFVSGNDAHQNYRQKLQIQLSEAEAAAKKLENDYKEKVEAVRTKIVQIDAFTDPTSEVENLNDGIPFLLMPVRLETRFKKFGKGRISRHQLWVRIYPDACSIDTFESVLSDAEVRNARAYWIEIWRAGGREDRKRAAWRSLVGSHGSGRAAWILENYKPQNMADVPLKAKHSDIILVIPTETPLHDPMIEKEVDQYWEAIWRADGNKAEEDAAKLALEAALGAAGAAEVLDNYRPANLGESPPKPLTKDQVNVFIKYVIFPNSTTLKTKRDSWTQPARVNIMPDRFVLLGYVGGNLIKNEIGKVISSPLIIGPDPSAKEGQKLRSENGEIVLDREMEWMVDFQRAVDMGMGFVVDLTANQYRKGFDRLLVLGVRLDSDEREGQALLEELIRHHQYSRSGFSLVPQGTPTNNTEQTAAGFSHIDDPDASYEDYFEKGSLFTEESNWMLKKDGQWLAEWLGIDPGVLFKVRHAGGRDQTEARAMNIALWPATMGYFLDTMMAPLFEDETICQARWFFNNFVIGRGMVPAVRIGRQPYGILPTTAFQRQEWPHRDNWEAFDVLSHPEGYRKFLWQMYELEKNVEKDWISLCDKPAHVGKKGDPHQMLLDIVGLHSGSVEYYQRYAESLEMIYNIFNLKGLGQLIHFAAPSLIGIGMQLLANLGYAGQEEPEILKKFILPVSNKLNDPNKPDSQPLIDDRPLSETETIRCYIPGPNGKNYIGWLADAARASLETIRLERGFIDDKPPTALLYKMLRHAVLLGYWDASLRLFQGKNCLVGTALQQAREEPKFIHLGSNPESESRWKYLYRTEPIITGQPDMLVADFIATPTVMGHLPETFHLNEQIEALSLLENAPTARLERVFAEHIDCVTYRLDAWKLGLIDYRLSTMRFQENETKARQGIYLGMYGWVEALRPEKSVLEPKVIGNDFSDLFPKEKNLTLFRDPGNAGYIHAPSLNQAVTAAVLRNGYLANASPDAPETLKVNLSSERVRRALSVIEGIRNGQSLAALLGYQFERGLHDNHNLGEVDKLIYKLRKPFPLAADRFTTTKTKKDKAIQTIEARNVMDGLALIKHIKKTGNHEYPFGLDTKTWGLPKADEISEDQNNAINLEVDKLLNLHDAVADLIIAESVHQVVQGNYDRASATLNSSFPDLPHVIQTPRSGIGLTHRVALQLEAGASSTVSPVSYEMTPRAEAEPALNKWLAAVLPDPANVACLAAKTPVTQEDIGLQPIDLLYMLNPENEQAMTALDDRIVSYIFENFNPRADVNIEIKYAPSRNEIDGKISFFEVSALVRSLRPLLLSSRPLRPGDTSLKGEATSAKDKELIVDRQRVDYPRNRMNEIKNGLSNDGLLVDVPLNLVDIISGIDVNIENYVKWAVQASAFGMLEAGTGFIFEWKRNFASKLLIKVNELILHWDEHLCQFDTLMQKYGALPSTASNEERFDLLQEAEILVSTQMTLPATPAAYEAILADKRNLFAVKKAQFESISSTAPLLLADLYNSIKAELLVDEFDLTGLDLSSDESEIKRFAGDLVERSKSLNAEMIRRIADVDAQVAVYDASSDPELRAQAIIKAAMAMFGDDFLMIPEFTLPPEQGDEWEKAYNDTTALLHHLKDKEDINFPVDNWLYGIARVREKMHQWENIIFLTNAFGRAEPVLHPIQLPYTSGDSWLALSFPSTMKINGERLLYTAHYAVPFDKTARQCGLLIDEWSEVIPARDETTGVAFHYDRPNNEPPQTFLLVTPPDVIGHWQWQDLVDALHETLDMAVLRAVEPDHVDMLPYARFLPATMMAVTFYAISISANLALDNLASEGGQ